MHRKQHTNFLHQNSMHFRFDLCSDQRPADAVYSAGPRFVRSTPRIHECMCVCLYIHQCLPAAVSGRPRGAGPRLPPAERPSDATGPAVWGNGKGDLREGEEATSQERGQGGAAWRGGAGPHRPPPALPPAPPSSSRSRPLPRCCCRSRSLRRSQSQSRWSPGGGRRVWRRRRRRRRLRAGWRLRRGRRGLPSRCGPRRRRRDSAGGGGPGSAGRS